MTITDVDPQQIIDDLRDELAEAYRDYGMLEDNVEDAHNDAKCLRGELDDLNTRARLAGHFCADDALTWIENRPDCIDTIAKWHDGAHKGSRKFCDEEPCKTLIREGWSLSD